MIYINRWIFVTIGAALLIGCDTEVSEPSDDSSSKLPGSEGAAKLTSDECIDPELALVSSDVTFMLCDGTMATGSLTIPQICESDGDRGCVVDGSQFKAAKLSGFDGKDIRTGVSIAGVSGSASVQAPCQNDGDSNCVVEGTQFKAAKLSSFNGSDILTGVSIAGVSGTASAGTTTPSCMADGEVGCVTSNAFKAAAISEFAAEDLKEGVSVAGVTGTLSRCNADGAIDCITDETFRAALNSSWTAYNDTVGTSAGNVTSYNGSGLGSGIDSGLLKDFRLGTDTTVTATMIATNLGSWDPSGEPAEGTPGYQVFGGILNTSEVATYLSGSSDWVYDVEFSGLDPTKSYEFVAFTNRNNSYSPQRWTSFNLIGADSGYNTSSNGVVEVSELELEIVSDNTANGDVVSWTGITTSDGTFTVRSRNVGTEGPGDPYKSYGMQAFRLREYTPSGN